jgi:hypothetical protein
MTDGLHDRLSQGPLVVAEGFVFELERSCLLQAGGSSIGFPARIKPLALNLSSIASKGSAFSGCAGVPVRTRLRKHLDAFDFRATVLSRVGHVDAPSP